MSKEKTKEIRKSSERKDIKDYEKKIEELTETLQRLQADFENYKKQVEKQNTNFKKSCKADFICKVLPILDSFELALKNNKDEAEFKKGVELIFSQFFQTLEDFGLRPIDTNGKFDPYKHEVLLTEESDKEPDSIIQELQKGYMMDDFVIRHSKVKVAKNNKKGD
jgi:molecular chaperone GrpE